MLPWLLVVAFAADPLEASGGSMFSWPPAKSITTLESAIEWVKAAEGWKRPRAETAKWLAEVLDYHVVNLNSPERMSLGENWIPFGAGGYVWETADDKHRKWRAANLMDPESTARWTWDNGIGQCGELAGTAYYILKQAGVSGNYRMYTAPGHEFAVWGLQDGADPNNPATWGPDAFIVDGWLGRAVTPEEALTSQWFKGTDGTGFINDNTTSFDHDAKHWTVDPSLGSGGGACFIATAAWGTPFAHDVLVLREFRQTRLEPTRAGRCVVAWYNEVGPIGAAWIRPRPRARAAVRWALRPAVVWLEGHRDAW